MYRFFIYECPGSSKTARPPYTVVFCPDAHFDSDELIEELKAHRHSEMTAFGTDTLVLGTESCNETLQKILSSPAREDLRAYAGTVHTLWQRPDGTVNFADKLVPDPDSVSETLRIGLQRLFQIRNPVLESSLTSHYQLPSGHHSARFARVGTMLSHGAEVCFLAFCLLPFADGPIKHIYTDTGTIHSTAYALIKLKKQLDQHFQSPTVESFRSYEGIENFKFHAKDDSIFLISASSGGLVRRLIERHGVDRRRIITLLHVNKRGQHDRSIFDMSSMIQAADLRFWQSFPQEHCPYCEARSVVIRLMGDQMLPERPRVEPVLITADEQPQWLPEFIREFVGKRVVRCHRRPSPERDPIEVYLDMEALLKSEISPAGANSQEGFVQRCDRMLRQVIPASLAVIVNANNNRPSSALAERVAALYQQMMGTAARDVPTISIQDIDNYPQTSGAFFIVADTMVSGRNLAAASRSLRSQKADRQIHYFVATTRTATEGTLREIRSNLQFGLETQSYSFNRVKSIYLPDNLLTRSSPWTDELGCLVRVRDWAIERDCEPKLIALIGERIDLLNTVSNGEGLEDDLFWGTPTNGARLRLRPEFAFWRSIDYGKYSQADVYFTITAVMHNARSGGQSGNPWSQHEHRRTILSPTCFHRYNDGLIQACLIRASEGLELDYREHPKASSAMRDMLVHSFAHLTTASGEAAIELVLALAMNKLRLSTEHLKDIVARLCRTDAPAIMQLFGTYIGDRVAEQEVHY